MVRRFLKIFPGKHWSGSGFEHLSDTRSKLSREQMIITYLDFSIVYHKTDCLITCCAVVHEYVKKPPFFLSRAFNIFSTPL